MMPMDGNIDRRLLRECAQNCISKTDKENQYRCELCRFKFNELALSSHISIDSKHRSKFISFKEDMIAVSLPEPCEAQACAIDEMVEEGSSRLLTVNQRILRMAAVQEIEATVNGWFPRTKIYLRPYGSIVSGFALDISDVNVELVLENEDEYNSAQILQNVAMQMSFDVETYSEIQKEFDISSPRFSFRYSSHSLGSESPKIHFGVYSSSSLEVAELLAKYVSFDLRVAKLAACFKLWAGYCGFDRADHGFWPSHSFHIMVIHFLQQTSPPVLPSLFPSDGSTPTKEEIDRRYAELRGTWSSLNKKTLGHLWLQLLAYYAIDFNRDNVVNIRGLDLTLSSKDWATCILAVEDPVHHSHNLSRSIGRKELYYNYHRNLVRTYSYFMAPRTRAKCLLDNREDFIQGLSSPCYRTQIASEDSDDDETKEKGSDEEFDTDEPRGKTKASKKELNFTYHVKLAKKFGISYSLRQGVAEKWASLSPQDFFYTLEIHRYPFFKTPQKYCIKCKRIDHHKKDCPAEKLPDLIVVPDTLSSEQSARLDEVCSRLYINERLDDNYEQVHESILQSLTSLVREIYPDANLQLFGSCKNGFGAKKCDLDLCLTFKDNEDGKGINQTEVIQKLADEFKKHSQRISNLTPIPQAKVPVLKLRFKLRRNVDGRSIQEHFDCDISLYNLLASHNTRLLRTYCQVDERVAMLGFTVKQFFKKCGICDASKGSLSSYAYTLMTLYYLQRCSPPVIPFLQELYDGDSPPERKVDGYNTWFFSDIDSLAQRWPCYHTNRLSVGNLFYGFLKFYAEIFPFESLVVCIRRSQELTKMEKKWTGRRIAIEDPFLHSHNLGQGIESEMARYIKASIILGRNRIGDQPDHFGGYDSWTDYFFDASYLNDGPFPKGRGCHYCNRIGHQKSNCPEKNRGKNKGDSPRAHSKQLKQGNRNRKAFVLNEFLDNEVQSPSKQSLLHNVQRQMQRLNLKKSQQGQLSNRSQYLELSSPSISGNMSNSTNERYRSSDRTLYNPNTNSHQSYPHHQQQFYRQQPSNHQTIWRPSSGNSNPHFNNNNHQNNDHHHHLKRNDPPNFHPQRQYPQSSPHISGNFNRQANLRFSSPRTPRSNYGRNDDYILRSPEFPELDNSSNNRQPNRRR